MSYEKSLLAWLVIAANWLIAHNSPVVKNTEQEIVKTLQIHKDTIDIVEKDLETKKVFNHICTLWIKDTNKNKDKVLYTTMKTINQKYWSPRATFDVPKFVIKDQKSGYYKFLKEIICIKHDKPELELFSRIAEMSHNIERFNKEISLWRIVKDAKTLMKNWWEYDEMYDIPGTIEYDAHSIIEPVIAKEILNLYIENIDTTKQEEIDQWLYILELINQSYKNDSLFIEKNPTIKRLFIEKEKEDKLFPNEANWVIEIFNKKDNGKKDE